MRTSITKLVIGLSLVGQLTGISSPAADPAAKKNTPANASGAAGSSTKGKAATVEAPAAKSGKMVPVYKMELSSNFAGPVTIEIAKDAISTHFVKMQLTMVTRAPKWIGYLYNDTTHAYAEMSPEQWRTHFMFKKAKKLTTLKSKSDGKTEKICGLDCKHIMVYNVEKLPQGKDTEELTAEIWTSPKIVPTAEIRSLLSTMLDLPVSEGFPIRAKHLQSNHRMTTVVDTYKCEQVSVPDSDFSPRPGFRKVRDEMAVMMDEDEDAMMGGADDAANRKNANMRVWQKAKESGAVK